MCVDSIQGVLDFLWLKQNSQKRKERALTIFYLFNSNNYFENYGKQRGLNIDIISFTLVEYHAITNGKRTDHADPQATGDWNR